MNKKGLRSHALPCIIVLAYMIDSIGEPITLLRGATLVLTFVYIGGLLLSAINIHRLGEEDKHNGAAL